VAECERAYNPLLWNQGHNEHLLSRRAERADNSHENDQNHDVSELKQIEEDQKGEH
jgi:hypothetical protein